MSYSILQAPCSMQKKPPRKLIRAVFIMFNQSLLNLFEVDVSYLFIATGILATGFISGRTSLLAGLLA